MEKTISINLTESEWKDLYDAVDNFLADSDPDLWDLDEQDILFPVDPFLKRIWLISAKMFDQFKNTDIKAVPILHADPESFQSWEEHPI